MSTLWSRYNQLDQSTPVATKLEVLIECFKQEEDKVLRSQAACDLGEMYYTGAGVTKSVERGKQLMQLAADMGNGAAMNRYGEMLADENNIECITYFCMALDKADSKAAQNLRTLYKAARNNGAEGLCDGIDAGVGEVARIQREERDDSKGDASVVLALIGVFGLGEKCGITQEQGMELVKVAAEKGNGLAQYILDATKGDSAPAAAPAAPAEPAPAAAPVKESKGDKDDFGKLEKESAKDSGKETVKAAAPQPKAAPVQTGSTTQQQAASSAKKIDWKLVGVSLLISLGIGIIIPIPFIITWPIIGYIMYRRKKKNQK